MPAPPRKGPLAHFVGRYGAMSATATFTSPVTDLRSGELVIAKTDRGTEVVEIAARVDDLQKLPTNTPFPSILRRMTPEDGIQEEKIQRDKCPEAFDYCAKTIDARRMPMKLAFIEHLFGGERIIFYFLAEGRVDFRNLVRELARRFQTRIELKQIGVRDEARLLADYEHCGRPLCCRTFIRKLQPVTMKMAKNQKATLDPSKISGACGRLMCCLRYEDKVYTELQKGIPKRGAMVEAGDVRGRLIDADVLRQTIVLDTDRGRVEADASEITAVHPRNHVFPRETERAAPDRGERPKRLAQPLSKPVERGKVPGKGPKASGEKAGPTGREPRAPQTQKAEGAAGGDGDKPPRKRRRKRRSRRRKKSGDETPGSEPQKGPAS